MISPLPSSYRSSSSRRGHYSRSPSDMMPSSKRLKPSSSIELHERYFPNEHDPHNYTSICVKNINPKISDRRVRELCDNKFSKYGTHSVKIFRKSNERIAFVNFTNPDDARRARQAKSDLVWEGVKVFLEPVFYRKSMPPNRPISPGSLHERFLANQRFTRRSPRQSPSPLDASRSHSYRPPPMRRQRSITPPPLPPSPLPLPRPSRRTYSPYIPLPPDLAEYVNKASGRSQQHSSPATTRRQHHFNPPSRQPRSRSPRSPVHRVNSVNELTIQYEPSRTLVIENLDRNATESTLNQTFSRYGIIEDIEIKKPSSSSKRPWAMVRFENMEMAYRARQAMDGQPIGETVSKIGYGKTGPTRHLWVGNIAKTIRPRDLEHTFSRYGQVEKFYCSFGSSTATVTYVDIEDAIKARTKLNGAIQLAGGQVIVDQSDGLGLSREGFHIDYYDRSRAVRRFINRLPQNFAKQHESRSPSNSPSRKSSSAASTPNRSRSASSKRETSEPPEENLVENVKTETHSRSPTPPVAGTIKQRRSTDRSQASSLTDSSPTAGRTFHGPLGSYLSPTDTAHVNNVNTLMILCEELNSSATQSNTALSTVYPVQFVLKSRAYEARMHFLAGSPTLASILLGQPGDLVAAKTELRITQRLRLEQHKLDDLDKKLRGNVAAALAIAGNSSNTNANGYASTDLTSTNTRKQMLIPNQTKFSILIASPKVYVANEASSSTKEPTANGHVKSERASPSPSAADDDHVKVKEETVEPNDDHNNNDDEEPALSRLISYLDEKEAAGVISMPFHPTYHNDYNHSSRQETAVVHIFPPCQFSKKVLKVICPSITFLDEPHTPPSRPSRKLSDEHLMVVIIHSE